MLHTTKKAGAVLVLAAAGTVALGAMASPALATDNGAGEAAGCTTRLVTAESATVGAYAPQVNVGIPITTIDIGNPNQLVNDTVLNASYFVDCVD